MRSLHEQIAHLKRKISELVAKEASYRNRRVRSEQKLNRLLKRRNAKLDSLHLTALRQQIKDDPEELSKLHATLDNLHLSDEERLLVGLPPKSTGSTAADAPDSGLDTSTTAPPPAANGADSDAPGAHDPHGTPAAPPDAATDAADDKPASHAHPVDGDAASSQPKAPPAEANVTKQPSPDAPAAHDPHGTPAAPPDAATDAADDKPVSHAHSVDGDAASSQPEAPSPEANVPKQPGPDAPAAHDTHGTPTARPDAAGHKPPSHAHPVDGDAASSQPKAPPAKANVPKEPGSDVLGAQDPRGTPATAPGSDTGPAEDKPASLAGPAQVAAAPSPTRTPPAGPNASAEPGDKPTQRQFKYIEDLRSKYPDKAKEIGIDSKSLSTLSKRKASWAIQQLEPPRTSAPRSRTRR